jgi:tetratricopeptide (TPR) repeat protein
MRRRPSRAGRRGSDRRPLAEARRGGLPEEARLAAQDPGNVVGKFVKLAPLGRGSSGSVWNWLAHAHLGVAHLHLREPQKAIEDFGRVLELNPRDAMSWFNRSIAWRDLEEQEPAKAREHLRAAKADLEKAVELAPPGPLRTMAERSLNRVTEALQRLGG